MDVTFLDGSALAMPFDGRLLPEKPVWLETDDRCCIWPDC
jgi:hypothetical protein